MKSIQYLLFILLFQGALSGFSQDEIYNEKKKKVDIEQYYNDSLVNTDAYATEKDYLEKNKEYAYEEEGANQHRKKRKKRNRSFAKEVVAEVVVEVFIHSLFLIATCWH